MQFVAYIYFVTPKECDVGKIFNSIHQIGLEFSHFGFSDPPRKIIMQADIMAVEIMKLQETNKLAYLKDVKNKIGMTIELKFDKRWVSSTISISGPNVDAVRNVAKLLTKKVESYLAIVGVMGGGKNQKWELVHKDNRCPIELYKNLEFA